MYIFLKCTKFLKINAGNSLSVAIPVSLLSDPYESKKNIY